MQDRVGVVPVLLRALAEQVDISERLGARRQVSWYLSECQSAAPHDSIFVVGVYRTRNAAVVQQGVRPIPNDHPNGDPHKYGDPAPTHRLDSEKRDGRDGRI